MKTVFYSCPSVSAPLVPISVVNPCSCPFVVNSLFLCALCVLCGSILILSTPFPLLPTPYAQRFSVSSVSSVVRSSSIPFSDFSAPPRFVEDPTLREAPLRFEAPPRFEATSAVNPSSFFVSRFPWKRIRGYRYEKN